MSVSQTLVQEVVLVHWMLLIGPLPNVFTIGFDVVFLFYVISPWSKEAKWRRDHRHHILKNWGIPRAQLKQVCSTH